MTDLFIEGSAMSPQIECNRFSGEIIISGRSIPENSAGQFEPLLNWVKDYIKAPRKTTNLRLDLEYFNSLTTIWISKVIRELSKIEDEKSLLVIHLYFDTQDFEDLDRIDLLTSIEPMHNIKVGLRVKIYGTDSEKHIIKESLLVF